MAVLSKLFTRALFLMLFSVFFLPATVSAEILGLAGWSGNDDDDHYGYVGAIIPWFNKDLDGYTDLESDGWRIRLWAEYTTFEYEGALTGGASGVPTTFEGDGPGGSAALGYQWHYLPSGKSTTYFGPRYRDIDVDPDDPSTEVDNDNFGLLLQQEFNQQITPEIDVSLIGSVTIGFEQAYWARLRPGYTLTNGWKIGPEVIALGNDVFDKQKYGAFISGIKLGNIGISLNVGVEDESSTSDNNVYGGVGLSTVF